jgi:hypothetical protein
MRGKFFLLGILFIFLTACTINKSPEDKFTVSLRLPANIKAGEAFELEAILKNNLDKNFELWHAGNLFGIAIAKEGDKFPDITFIGSLIHSKLPAKSMISEKYRFVLDEPGQYKVLAKASFTVDQNDPKKSYIIDSEIIRFVVK